MALPKQKIKYLLTTIKLPSNPKVEIKVRPFTGEEEKLFLLLKESKEDLKKIQETVIQVISNCTVFAPTDFKIEDLSIFDVEYIFLQLHSISIDNFIEFSYNNEEKILCNENCPDEIKVKIAIQDIKVEYPESSNNSIVLYDREDIGMLGITLKYPTTGIMEQLVEVLKADEVTQLENVIFLCIHSFFDKDQVYVVNKNDENEVEETKKMISSFTIAQKNEIKKFFNDMPSVKHSVDIVCPSCSRKETIVLQGLNDFFFSPSSIEG